MSIFMGAASVITGYLWWTNDWWLPKTLTGTRVGFEDFIVGFGSGGIVAAIYEVVWKKRHIHMRKKESLYVPAWILLLIVALGIGCLIWLVGLTSFMASSIVMLLIGISLLLMRPDLSSKAVKSGMMMVIFSYLFFYVPILLIFPGWISVSYLSEHLSGVYILKVPIEEFIFWFLAGFIFGPWYEYWKHDRLRAMPVKAK